MEESKAPGKFLVTGFTTFAGHVENPSQLLVESLSKSSDWGQVIETLVLPVSYESAARSICEKMNSMRDLRGVLMFGLAHKRERISLERTALNWIESGIPDNEGNFPPPGLWRKGRPFIYFNQLPISNWAEELNEMGIPAEVSLSAGGYVCNSTSFAVAEALESTNLPWLFVHLPSCGTLSQFEKLATYLLHQLNQGTATSNTIG